MLTRGDTNCPCLHFPAARGPHPKTRKASAPWLRPHMLNLCVSTDAGEGEASAQTLLETCQGEAGHLLRGGFTSGVCTRGTDGRQRCCWHCDQSLKAWISSSKPINFLLLIIACCRKVNDQEMKGIQSYDFRNGEQKIPFASANILDHYSSKFNF